MRQVQIIQHKDYINGLNSQKIFFPVVEEVKNEEQASATLKDEMEKLKT